MIFMLVVLAPVTVKWPKGAGRQVSDASGFEESGREPDEWPETPPKGSPTTPGALGPCPVCREALSASR